MSDAKLRYLGNASAPWTLPESDLARQAIGSFRGYVYQLHQSAAAWIRLTEGDLLHLEVAEDFAQVLREPGGLDDVLAATQVKDTRESGRVTLNSPDVLDAIQALFRLQMANEGREVRLTFLTTSEIGLERKKKLPSGAPGLQAWRAAAAGGNVAEIRDALVSRIPSGDLNAFLQHSSDEQLRTQLLAPLTFACGACDWQLIDRANRAALANLHREVQSTPAFAAGAYNALLCHLITTILTSPTRSLDRKQLITFLAGATTIPLPSELAIRVLGEGANARIEKPLDRAQLETLAQTLLDEGSPPSILVPFPDATDAARAALTAAMERERTVVERVAASGTNARVAISELVAMPERKHLVIAASGSGKTLTLWQCARGLLETRGRIPLYLPIGQLNSWAEAVAILTDAAAPYSAETVFADDRVCVFLDGWSEFATGEHAAEKQKALRALRQVRVIANGKFADVGDTVFKVWSLEPLSTAQVTETREKARPGSPALAAAVVDLLRLPLLLSLHVLSSANASAPGELLRQFHAHVARNLPEAFTEALARTVATLSLTNDRSYGRFSAELQAQAKARGIAEPLRLLQCLGTILERGGYAVPVHDLYWSWLAGRGLVTNNLAPQALTPLHTRESYALAFQSGTSPDPTDVERTLHDDLILATALEAARRSVSPHAGLGDALERALQDSRLAVRNRGGLAALALGTPEYLRRALTVLSEISQAGLHVPDWGQALDPTALFLQRVTLAQWLGSPGSDIVLDAIATRGGPQWLPWLGQMLLSGKIAPLDALATALACAPEIPPWGATHLDELLTSAPWKLVPTIDRRANRVLARYIAVNYERLIEGVAPNKVIPPIHLSRLLVSCGDDEIFQLLLGRFASASPAMQEFTAWAACDRGPPWISAFQKAAFAVPRTRKGMHKLSETVSLDINDDTARKWIAAGNDDISWRVLIARHNAAVVPELVADLPQSFADIGHVPALSHLRYLKEAPASLIAELMRRFGSPMRPKVLEDVLDVLAQVHPQGMVHIVNLIRQQPDGVPLYHIAQALQLYRQWRERSGMTLMVGNPGDTPAPFDHWIVRRCALQRWDEHFVPRMLSGLPELAIDLVLGAFRIDDDKALKVLNMLKDVKCYHAELLEWMLSRPKLTPLVPAVFAACFDTFPVEALQRCTTATHIDQNILLLRLAASGNPLHLSVHAQLIRRLQQQPINLYNYRFLASALNAHTRYDVIELLKKSVMLNTDNAIWFVREVETARGERLIDETAHFRV